MQMGNKYIEKGSTSLVIREMGTKITRLLSSQKSDPIAVDTHFWPGRNKDGDNLEAFSQLPSFQSTSMGDMSWLESKVINILTLLKTIKLQ